VHKKQFQTSRNHGIRKSETNLEPVNSLTGYSSSLAFGSVTSFFGIKGTLLRFSLKQQDESATKFFQGLGENTCSLRPALKSNVPGF